MAKALHRQHVLSYNDDDAAYDDTNDDDDEWTNVPE